MSQEITSFNVSIAPSIYLYKTLKDLPFTLEVCLAEFIDNAVQSYLDYPSNRRGQYKEKELIVSIEIDSEKRTIVIEDNAFGIQKEHLEKALQYGLAGRKHKGSSLSAYGIGMKIAAIWISDSCNWQLETTAAEKSELLQFEFNLDKLLKDNSKELSVFSQPAKAEKHWSRITIYEYNTLLGKKHYQENILPHLLETYMRFDFLKIKMFFNDEELSAEKNIFKASKALVYPKVNKKGDAAGGDDITWKKDIDMVLTIKGVQHKVKGYFMIMEKGSYNSPGLRLFRNNRIIMGTMTHPNKPDDLFSTKNKYSSQRFYGELNVNSLNVDFTKVSIEQEELNFLYTELKDELQKDPNYFNQATNYRVGKKQNNNTTTNSQAKGKHSKNNKIASNQELGECLEKLANEKVIILYDELTKINIKQYSILSYLGASAFLENLASHIKGEDDGNNYTGFYNNIIDTLNYDKGKKKYLKEIFRKINDSGNFNKHNPSGYTVNAEQLALDFVSISEVLISSIKTYLNKN